MSDFSQQSKAEVRRRILAARRARTDRSDADAALRRHLVALAAGRETVAGYVPLATEPGGARLPAALAAVCGRLLIPVLLPDLDLDWRIHPDAGGAERPGLLGPAAITAADLVIVPAVAVDRRGIRLGRGGGSYDRVLARIDGYPAGAGPSTVAVLYPDEFVDALPAEPHDRRVSAVVTPAGLTRL